MENLSVFNFSYQISLRKFSSLCCNFDSLKHYNSSSLPPSCRCNIQQRGQNGNQIRVYKLKLLPYCLNYPRLRYHESDAPASCHPMRLPSRSTVVASASSVSGSSGEYSERLFDTQTKKKKQIAGIDQDELVDPKLLADPDSCFCEFRGVHIHHKVYDIDSQLQNSSQIQTLSQLPQQRKAFPFPMILLHGFGASVWSWKQVMKPLAEVVGSKVLAFDRPAFGLTSRMNYGDASSGSDVSKPLNPYSLTFSVLATLFFIDLIAAEKAILIGHSAGSLIAVNTYFEAPERVAALVLVAPAIFAPLTVTKGVAMNRFGDKEQMEQGSGSLKPERSTFWLYRPLINFFKHIAKAIMQILKGMTNMLNYLYRKLLAVILRSALAVMLVRMVIDKFGIAAVKNAWYDSKRVTEQVIYDYTRPLKVKDWDRALVEYTAAMLLDNGSNSKPPLSQRLKDITCPVLIVTGDSDRLVPSWNAERLSRAIPGSSFEVIKQCGHLPHEEKVEEFVAIVEKFLRTVFVDSDEQRLRAVT